MATLYDNSAERNCDNTAAVWTDHAGGPGAAYVSFTPAATVTLSSVQVNIHPDPIVGNGIMNFTANIYHDSGSNTPGSLIATIATINVNVATCSPGDPMYDLGTLAANPTLNNGTRYWLGLISNGAGDSTNIGPSTDTAGTGVAGEYHTTFVAGSLTTFTNNVTSNSYIATIAGAVVVVTRGVFFGQSLGGAPFIVADGRGIVMLFHYLTPNSLVDVLSYAFTVDVLNFTGWNVRDIWNWQTDTNPPPADPSNPYQTDLQPSFGFTLYWLSQDVQDGARSRAYVSLEARSTLVSGFQQIYVGTIEWDSVTPS